MDMIIHAYGYAETIHNTLNALAAVRNSNLWPAMITTVSLMVGTYYSWRMAGSQNEGQWRVYLKQVLGMLLLINVLLIPTQTMYIKDHVEKHFWKVDNIPLAFALPVGVVEELGHLITMTFEQAFSKVGSKSSFNYYHYGTAFGARLSKEVMEAKIRDPEVVSNMHNFMKRCVILPAMIGHQFTKEELVDTNDIWSLVSANAGTFTRTDMTINGTRQSPAPTCREAIPYFEKKMQSISDIGIKSLSSKFKAVGSNKEMSENAGAKQLNDNLRLQIAAVYNVGGDKVDNILKHNMMINALNDYRGGKFPAVRAKLQHEAGGLISGDLADHILTGLLAVMKNLLYGSFIFVVPLMLMSSGISKYRMWITFCLSLQLWPALSAMLNMLIDYAYDPAKIVSYSSWSTEYERFDSMASIAANLTLVIPFLAVWLTRMGEGGFMHLAGSIMSSASGAVSAAAGEKSTGTRSWDNENIDNTSRNNENSNKINTSMEYVKGGNGFMQADGSMERITPGGNVVRVGGAGSTASTGETSYAEHVGVGSAINTSIRDEQSAVVSESVAQARAKEEVESFEAQGTYTIAENTRTDNGYNIDISTETGRELVKGFNEIDRITKSNDYSWQQNAKAYARANVSFGKSVGELFGFGGAAELGGEVEALNGSTQSDSVSNESGNEASTHDRSGISERMNRNDAYLESLGIDMTQLESARAAYNESNRLEESIAAHKDEIKSWNQVKEQSETSGAESRKELFPEVVKELQNKYGYDRSQAWQAASQRTPEAQDVFMNISGQKAIAMKEQTQVGKQSIESSTAMNDIKNNVQIDKDSINSAMVKKFKDDHDMEDKLVAETKVSKSRAKLHGQFVTTQENNSGNIEAVNTKLNAKHNNREEDINKLEEDRIGKGLMSKGIGGAVNVVSLGNAGSNIGRPSEEEPMPEFEPIMKYYGSDTMISSLDEELKVVRPPVDNDIDFIATQKEIDGFYETNKTTNTDMQYAEAKKNEDD